MTTTLTDFLLARIAEDEAEAHDALGLLGIETEWHTVDELRERGLTRADAQHVHTWSSRRVLAECEAKRQIVELHEPIPEAHFPTCGRCGMYGERDVDWPCETLRALALPCADHPDYRDEWRP